MPSTPALPDPGRDDDPRPVPAWPDWMDGPGYLALRDADEDWDLSGQVPGDDPPPEAGEDDLAVGAAAEFASGRPLDVAPAGPVLGSFLTDAAGEDDRYQGVSDDALEGLIAGWDRMEAYDCSRKHAAIAELARRRPDPDCPPPGPGEIPEGIDEFLPRELGSVLGETSRAADGMIWLACELETSLPGTRAAFRAGTLSHRKATIIASATALLDREEARAAEALVLERAGALTPPALKAAILRAVMEVNADKARKRREHEAKKARVERWAEDSGNASLAGRELPPAQVLAADQRVTAWAKELRNAGLAGDMDQLRARAYLDLLLGVDSRLAAAPGGPAAGQVPDRAGGGAGGDWSEPASGEAGLDWPVAPGPVGPAAASIPPGFAGHVTLTIPAATLTGLADRPAELGGIGPIDPDLARDLAAAAARNPRSTWCVTVTDSLGHAVAHGCARPARRRSRDGHDPPGSSGGPGFTLTPTDHLGTWRFTIGHQDMLIQITSLSAGDCDHRHQAQGHDPGVLLRHLTQVRHATCTGPGCRRPAGRCDFEHNTPYEAGGRTCLCNGNPQRQR